MDRNFMAKKKETNLSLDGTVCGNTEVQRHELLRRGKVVKCGGVQGVLMGRMGFAQIILRLICPGTDFEMGRH